MEPKLLYNRSIFHWYKGVVVKGSYITLGPLVLWSKWRALLMVVWIYFNKHKITVAESQELERQQKTVVLSPLF